MLLTRSRVRSRTCAVVREPSAPWNWPDPAPPVLTCPHAQCSTEIVQRQKCRGGWSDSGLRSCIESGDDPMWSGPLRVLRVGCRFRCCWQPARTGGRLSCLRPAGSRRRSIQVVFPEVGSGAAHGAAQGYSWPGSSTWRGHSSAGRAPALQAGGHGFESRWLHLTYGTRSVGLPLFLPGAGGWPWEGFELSCASTDRHRSIGSRHAGGHI